MYIYDEESKKYVELSENDGETPVNTVAPSAAKIEEENPAFESAEVPTGIQHSETETVAAEEASVNQEATRSETPVSPVQPEEKKQAEPIPQPNSGAISGGGYVPPASNGAVPFYLQPKPKKQHNGTGKKVIAILIAAVICFGAGFAGCYLCYNLFGESAVRTEVKYVGTGDEYRIILDSEDNLTTAEVIAEKVVPSVVGISTVITSTYSGNSFFDFFGGGGQTYSYDSTAEGSGVIVDPDGYILTNSHVVNDGSFKSITVSLYDGSEMPAELLWNEASLDLAIIKIDASNLIYAELGDSDTVKVGAYALAIGNPLGLKFSRSLSQGIISGLDRSITVSDSSSSYSGSYTTMEGLIQTDAAINSGNSGGPLLNSKGEVIAINTARSGSGENMGFAIPINIAKPILEEVKETGTFDRVYIGISGIGLSEQSQYTSSQLQEYFGTTSGVYISKVYEGGGAKEAGLKSGDIIISVDGKAVDSMNKINSLIIGYEEGDVVELEIIREKQPMTVSVTLTENVSSTEVHTIENYK